MLCMPGHDEKLWHGQQPGHGLTWGGFARATGRTADARRPLRLWQNHTDFSDGRDSGPGRHVLGIYHDLTRMGAARQDALPWQAIGFVFQAFNLFPSLTAAENVAVPLLIHGMRRREALA